MGSIVYDACLPEKKPDDDMSVAYDAGFAGEGAKLGGAPQVRFFTRKQIMDDLAVKDDALFSKNSFVSDTGDETSPKVGSTVRIRFPGSFTIVDGPLPDWGKPAEPGPAPSFTIYEPGRDEMVPLTHVRLDELVAIEKHYIGCIKMLRMLTDGSRLEVNTQRHSSENAKYSPQYYDNVNISLREITEYCPGGDSPADG